MAAAGLKYFVASGINKRINAAASKIFRDFDFNFKRQTREKSKILTTTPNCLSSFLSTQSLQLPYYSHFLPSVLRKSTVLPH
jgi:hypothetical protein